VRFDGHRQRLGQALLNVVIRALEAMPNGGHFTLNLERRPGTITITVDDTGPGVPLDDAYGIHCAVTDGGGTRVGLYLVRTVVESYQGSVSIDAQAGRGTRVRIELPSAVA